MNFSLEILKNDLGAIRTKLADGLPDLINETAHAVEADAKQRAPVDTGFLRNSIQTTIRSKQLATVDVGAEYGIYQEYGTHRMAAHPYITPAGEAARDHFIEAAKRLLD